MNANLTDNPEGPGWVDVAACTLPTAERPLRLAELDDLFGTSLRAVDRISDTRAILTLAGDSELTHRAQGLADAESACCSFFTFRVSTTAPGQVRIDIEVPTAYSHVLAALVARAESSRGGVS
jgi:hypothetical protein